MDIRVVITAAGSGSRFGGNLPKQFMKLGTKSILECTIDLFISCKIFSEIIVVLPCDYVFAKDAVRVVSGKKTRAESVYEGLKVVSLRPFSDETIVLVHDGVRPFASKKLINDVVMNASKHGAAIAATRVTDTIKNTHDDLFIRETICRRNLFKAATPQGFRIGVLLESFKKAEELGYLQYATDEAYLAEKCGYPVYIVEGNPENIKITTQTDMVYAKILLDLEEEHK